MNRRGLFAALASLALAAPALAAMPRPRLGPDPTPDEALTALPHEAEAPELLDVQYRRRHRRCRWETRQIRYRDRRGRLHFRTVRQEVCW
jgi:hypothetical protein